MRDAEDKNGQTHFERMTAATARHNLARPCTAHDMTFGGRCLNCGFEPFHRPAVVAPHSTGHTPGPWTLQQLETRRGGYEWETFAVRSPANVCLATVGSVDRYQAERIPANARLIAAAPRMVAALRDALPVLEADEYLTMIAGGMEILPEAEEVRAILREIDGGQA